MIPRPLHPVLVLLSLAGALAAQPAPSVQFPLDGYYRVGRYMPVRVSTASGGLTLAADGAVPTRVFPSDSPGQVVVPLLVYGNSAGPVRCSAGEIVITANAISGRKTEAGSDTPLHPLNPDDRLVGFATSNADIARDLFPGKQIIPIRLDPAVPLPGAIEAWESLDAVLLDKEPPYEQVLELLSAGVLVGIRTDQPPDAPLPWNHLKGYWYITYAPSGWTGTQVNELAYQPTFSWIPGRQDELRNMVLLIAILFTIATLAMALFARRATAGTIVVGVITTIVVLTFWLGRQSPIRQTGAQAIVTHPLIQRDSWMYQTTLSESDVSFPWQPLLHPMFFSTSQPHEMNLELTCDSNGTPREYRYHLKIDHRAAFVSRTIGGEHPTRFLRNPVDSPLLELVRAVYLRPNDKVIGQITAPGEFWADVVVRPGR